MIGRWIAKWKEKRAAAKDANEHREIAQRFNNRYTYNHQWKPGMPFLEGSFYGVPHRQGYAWMCYECNSIHHPETDSVWSGLQYPACCSTGAGHRLDEKLL